MIFLCFANVDIMWYHRLLAPLEFERQSSCDVCFDKQVGREIKKNRNGNGNKKKIKLYF